MLYLIYQLLEWLATPENYYVNRHAKHYLFWSFRELTLCFIATIFLRIRSVKLKFTWAELFDILFSFMGLIESLCFAGVLSWFIAYTFISYLRKDEEYYQPFDGFEVVLVLFIGLFFFPYLLFSYFWSSGLFFKGA